jgi:hypothetical protein
MPTFILSPKRFPEGCVSNISGVIGRMPEGPGAWVATDLISKSGLSSTDVSEMFWMGLLLMRKMKADAVATAQVNAWC